MKHYEFSAFWLAVKKLLSLRFMAAFVLMLLCLEGVARICPHIIPKDVHLRFLYSNGECKIDCTNNGRKLEWIANERGARGGFYQGQPVRIAVFGSSTSIDSLLDQSETWAEQLRRELGPDIVHLDNYARDGAGGKQAKVIFDHLFEIGRHYDIILVMTQRGGRGGLEKDSLHYWGNWSLAPGFLKFPNLLRRRAKVQVKTEPRLNFVDRFIHDELFPKPSLIPRVNRETKRLLRLSGQLNFVDIENYGPDPAAIVDIRNGIRAVLESANRVADKVYFLLQPVAYSPDEHPGVAKRWYLLRPVKGRDGYFVSNKSVAQRMRKEHAIMNDVAADMGIAVIDLDGFIQSKLSERGDMFEDKWHFSPAGAEIGARFIAETLRSEHSELRQ
jgi:hypothetical protein